MLRAEAQAIRRLTHNSLSPCDSLALFHYCFPLVFPAQSSSPSQPHVFVSVSVNCSPPPLSLFFFNVSYLQLRSSFKQAFSKKKSPKSASSHSDIEEMTDSSLPSSPKLPHHSSTAGGHMLRNTHSNTLYVHINICVWLQDYYAYKVTLLLLESQCLMYVNCVLYCLCVQIVRVFGQRGGDGDAAAQWAQGEGDETDRYPPGGSQLRTSAGPAPRGHEPHAGLWMHTHQTLTYISESFTLQGEINHRAKKVTASHPHPN